MSVVASRVLRNDTRSVLQRVEQGEEVTITIAGHPVAVLKPITDPPVWMSRDEFVARVLPAQADPGLAADLAEIAPDTTDTLRL